MSFSIDKWIIREHATKKTMRYYKESAILSFNPLTDMPILGFFNSAANKDMM